MLRAVPEMTRNAASSEFAFMSFGLHFDDVQNLFARHLADLVLVRLFEPAVMPAAFFSKMDAGGDLVMNVNDF